MDSFFVQHQIGLLVFLALLLVIAASNVWGLRRIESYPAAIRLPRVSVLVPARNEEENIGPCVRSLLAQDYPAFEVLVLNDASTDGTGPVLEALARQAPGLRVLHGADLPPGWLGKHWACHQLADAAHGELLLFTDADTRHHSATLSDAVAALLAEDADLLTALPHEEALTLGEQLTVPILPWSIYCFLPVSLAHRLAWPPMSLAVGQFMLFRRSAYQRIGGFASVRRHATDDIALARNLIAAGLRWRLVDAGRRVRCRMYRGFSQAYSGLGRTLFAAFDYNAWLFVPIWLWLAVVFLEPPVVLALSLSGRSLPALSVGLAAGALLLALLLWLVFCLRRNYPPSLAVLHPVIIALALTIAGRSLWFGLTGRTSWKGRTLSQTTPD